MSILMTEIAAQDSLGLGSLDHLPYVTGIYNSTCKQKFTTRRSSAEDPAALYKEGDIKEGEYQ